MSIPSAFVLLDDSRTQADAAGVPQLKVSRLYTQWVRALTCSHPDALRALLQQAHQACVQHGLHAVLLADYEWGLALQGLTADAVSAAENAQGAGSSASGQLQIHLFASLQRLSKSQADAWLAQQHEKDAALNGVQAGVFNWRTSVSQQQFSADVQAIHAAIAQGRTYQVNYTFAFDGLAYGSPVALYRQLRERQPAEFGALMHLPQNVDEAGSVAGEDMRWVLSCSPELFVRGQGGKLTARPMKGTAPVGDTLLQTQQRAQWLRTDGKNRAENVMIVDLLRNDLGRVAQTGSVRASRLFDVQAHGKVLQMTSQVEAVLKPGKGLADVLEAVFPCGSITGAPKRETMRLIAALEGYRRGLYTGAIGWLDATSTATGALQDVGAGVVSSPPVAWDFCLSVPIRTLLLEPSPHAGLHAARLPVGAGMVWESRAEAEWQECQLKSRFATASPVGFALFETMRYEPAAGGLCNLDAHFARLQRSAQALGFMLNEGAARNALQNHVQALPPQPHRVRLALQADGGVDIASAVLPPLAPMPQAGLVTLLLWPQPCRTPAWLRQHKTTLRSDYDEALDAALAQGAFDALFFNEQGYLTEGARSNVFVQIDGQWLTPPVAEGLLPGTWRAQMLQDARLQAREGRITRAQLQRASAIMVGNALRGSLAAELLPSQ